MQKRELLRRPEDRTSNERGGKAEKEEVAKGMLMESTGFVSPPLFIDQKLLALTFNVQLFGA